MPVEKDSSPEHFLLLTPFFNQSPAHKALWKKKKMKY